MTIARGAAVLGAALLAACGTMKMPQGTPVTIETLPPGERPLNLAMVPVTPPSVPSRPATPPMPVDIPQPTAAVEKRTNELLDKMRAVKAAKDRKQAEQYNRDLQDAWKYFAANPSSVHVLRRALAREMTLQRGRNDFLLLDLGYFLHERGQPGDRELARNALFALDPAAEVIKFNQQELFQLTQAVAASRDARTLAFIDRAFLRPGLAVRIAEADLSLDASLTAGYLYGAYGDGAEAHLLAMLKTPVTDKALVRRVLEILSWIGTPASNQAVKNILLGASHDTDTFIRTATVLMGAGGPQGRAIMMAVPPDDLDIWTAAYYEKIAARVRTTTFYSLRSQLESDKESARVLDSDKPRADLVTQLYDDRLKVFRTAPTRANVAEIQRLNSVLNALRYRDT